MGSVSDTWVPARLLLSGYLEERQIPFCYPDWTMTIDFYEYEESAQHMMQPVSKISCCDQIFEIIHLKKFRSADLRVTL